MFAEQRCEVEDGGDRTIENHLKELFYSYKAAEKPDEGAHHATLRMMHALYHLSSCVDNIGERAMCAGYPGKAYR